MLEKNLVFALKTTQKFYFNLFVILAHVFFSADDSRTNFLKQLLVLIFAEELCSKFFLSQRLYNKIAESVIMKTKPEGIFRKDFSRFYTA